MLKRPPSQLAVVTGASRGLGRELALALAREGYDLAITARNQARLSAVAHEVITLGAKCQLNCGDLGFDHILTAHKAWLESMAPIDVLINNAGYAQPLGPLEKSAPLEEIRSLKVNLHVPVELIRSVLPNMKRRHEGTIVNICSLSGRRAIRNMAFYCASKFALRGLTESLGQELEGTGVRCFSASPGGFTTEMREKLFGDSSQQQDPATVAKTIVEAVSGKISVPQGGDLVIRGGTYIAVPREQWIGIVRGAAPEPNPGGVKV